MKIKCKQKNVFVFDHKTKQWEGNIREFEGERKDIQRIGDRSRKSSPKTNNCQQKTKYYIGIMNENLRIS